MSDMTCHQTGVLNGHPVIAPCGSPDTPFGLDLNYNYWTNPIVPLGRPSLPDALFMRTHNALLHLVCQVVVTC